MIAIQYICKSLYHQSFHYVLTSFHYLCTCVPYLSALKLGPYTYRDSNICRVVQQNEWNKCRVPKLLNPLHIKMVPYNKKNEHILDTCISLDMWILLLKIATVNHLQHICHISPLDIPTWCTYMFYQSYNFINVLAFMHAIKLINSDTGTCHSTLDKWTIGNKCQDLNRHRTRLNGESKTIYM